MGKQYSCDHGGAGKAMELWWCKWESNTVVITVVQVRQYSCGGVGGKAIIQL